MYVCICDEQRQAREKVFIRSMFFWFRRYLFFYVLVMIFWLRIRIRNILFTNLYVIYCGIENYTCERKCRNRECVRIIRIGCNIFIFRVLVKYYVIDSRIKAFHATESCRQSHRRLICQRQYSYIWICLMKLFILRV